MDQKRFLTLGIPYFIAVGACYQFGYWGSTGINVLEFIGLAEIAKLAVYPLIAGMTFTIFGAVLSEVIVGKQLPVGGGANTPVGQFGRRYARPITAIVLIAIVIIYYFGKEPFKWQLMATLFAVTFALPLSHQDSFIKEIQNPKIRYFFILIALLLPPYGFAIGKVDIYRTINLIDAKTVDVVRSKLTLLAEKEKPVIYLGLLGSTFILRETMTGQLILIKQNEESPLFINPPTDTPPGGMGAERPIKTTAPPTVSPETRR